MAIWGAGPIGQMCADFSFINGASRVIIIDSNWRLDYVSGHGRSRRNQISYCLQVKEKYPKVETLDFSQYSGKKGVVNKLKEMVDGYGPHVALECVAGEYPKGWAHTLEIAAGLETDTSEILNEMIESVRNYGRVGVTGVKMMPVVLNSSSADCCTCRCMSALPTISISVSIRPYWRELIP